MDASLNIPATAAIVARANALFEDLSFTAAREWKAAGAGRKVVGYMPIYVPREIVHAANMLPLGVLGGGDQLEVIHGDAYYQSYIFHMPDRLRITSQIEGNNMPSTKSIRPDTPSSIVERGMRQI